MLKINIEKNNFFNESNNEFIEINEHTLELEHSLVSLSKWESKWKKPFISNDNKTQEETLDYIKCMLLNEEDYIYLKFLSTDNIKKINNYIQDSMTATTFYEEPNNGRKKEIITSELIYYWMIASNIPMECEKWHLNRLLTLIRICSIKNTPPKKMNTKEIMSRNKILNEARKKQLNTKG